MSGNLLFETMGTPLDPSELDRRRLNDCRLIPARALNTLDEAAEFVEERGLLTMTADSALPSLFGAIHEEPFAPGKRGFGSYPKTKWWWPGALGQLDSVVPTRLHRGKTLYLSRRTADLVDPLCRAELHSALAGEFGEPARQIVEHLGSAGPSLLEELKDELGLDAAQMRAARQKLESRGVLSSTGARLTSESGAHTHSSRLSRWDQLVAPAQGSTVDAIAELTVVGVKAAVIAPRREVARWFNWRIEARLVDGLIAAGRLVAHGDRLSDASGTSS
jgi:hypothetical protein